MKITPNRLQTHWPAVQYFLKQEWPRLTDVDCEEIDGQYDRLIHKVKELYGGDEIQIEGAIKTKLQGFLNSLEA